MTNQKGLTPVLVVILLTIILSVVSFFVYQIKPSNPTDQVACTQEAKLCPDGTSVGRVGPRCEFAPCPIPKESTSSADMSNWKTYTNTMFTFKYPPNGYVQTDQPSQIGITNQNYTPPYFIFRIEIKNNPDHLTTKQLVQKKADDNSIYDFTINNGNGEVDASYEKMLDQILSTFKFQP